MRHPLPDATFLGGMIERRHRAVMTVASAAGLVGVAKRTDYSASKFAAVGFAESLRVELGKASSSSCSVWSESSPPRVCCR